MVNALVVRKTQLPTSQKTFRAAQYVRMSTDYQRYSIENQAAVIAAYAQLHDLSIIRTYRDEGESGLKLKNRAGLAQLLNDVSADQADLPHNLRGESWKHHESLHRTGQVDECEARKSKRKYLHSYLVRLNFVNSR